MNETLEGFAFDWDAEIETDGQENIILPEGDYTFYVEKMERGAFPGSEKIPPCNKVTLTLRVKTDEGKTATIWTDLILYSTLEWKISSFFRSIGQKKRGEKLKMNWNAVVGVVGRAHIKPRTYTNKNGEERTVNDVSKYIDWDSKYAEPSTDFVEIPAPEDNSDLPF